MGDLLLQEREQSAVRALLVWDPAGVALSADDVLRDLARLIPCDAAGTSIVDDSGEVVSQAVRPRDTPAAGALEALEVLTLPVRTGRDRVARFWLARRRGHFTERDRALLRLMAPALERILRAGFASGTADPLLTCQERRVLGLVAEGLSNGEIAERLSVKPCTVRKHLEHGYRKLGVRNRLAAVHALDGLDTLEQPA